MWEEEKAPSPNVPAGWYPDPTQPGSQRYWDGNEWTDQRAPLPQGQAKSGSWSPSASPRLVIGLLGAIGVVIACFLPRAESSEVLTIANNTLMANGDAIIAIIFALGAGLGAVRDSTKPKVSWSLAILGLVVIGFAVLEGTGERLKVVNGFGAEVETQAGPAIWALGISGALITLAGFLQSPAPSGEASASSP